MSPANIGARLDRLPITRHHHKVFWLVASGMLVEGFDIYLAASVLASTYKSGFSTIAQNGLYISALYFGMTLGALAVGFWGDRYGRRAAYQINLAIFGAASILSILSPDMTLLIVLRFFMGLGMGAEHVVGYSIMTEFFPARVRGRWSGLIALCVTSGLPIAAFVGWLVIPAFGWRAMFAVAAVGAFTAWYLRRDLPESPRWLAVRDRGAEAEALVAKFEQAAALKGPLPPIEPSMEPVITLSAKHLFQKPYLSRLIVGSTVLAVQGALLSGFIVWLPTYLVQQGASVALSNGFAFMMALGGPIGSVAGAQLADRLGRKPTIIGVSSFLLILGALFSQATSLGVITAAGFALTVPIYMLVVVFNAIYVPEQFPTEFRLRGVGLCNTAGRCASICTPLVVSPIFAHSGMNGVLLLLGTIVALMIPLVAWLGVELGRGAAFRPGGPDFQMANLTARKET